MIPSKMLCKMVPVGKGSFGTTLKKTQEFGSLLILFPSHPLYSLRVVCLHHFCIKENFISFNYCRNI